VSTKESTKRMDRHASPESDLSPENKVGFAQKSWCLVVQDHAQK
jgi:hypothetical protein